jgi:acyl-CoA reductase-like NAD-dependent aldehyde dehydrogenase
MIKDDMIFNYNPSNIKELVSQHQISSEDELNTMLRKSALAFRFWNSKPAPKRAEYLLRARNIFAERKTQLAELLHQENGKPLEEALGEVQEVVDVFDFFIGEGRRMYGLTGQSEMPNKEIITIREALGPCVFITAWNFPMAVPAWKAAPALIAGNTFILKPSELAPLSGKLFVDILNEAGLPEGVAQIAYGAGDVGEHLIKSPYVKLVSFTGSVPVGKHVSMLAAEGFKKCALELGGKNSAIVLADANLDLVEDGVLWGAYGTGGQRCTSTSRLIIDQSISNTVIERLSARVKNFYDENSKKSAIDYTPIISEKQLHKIHNMVTEALEEGAELITGGKILDDGSHNGYYYAPTILRARHGMKITREEVFGPVLAVIEVESASGNRTEEDVLHSAVMIANDIKYGLSNAVYTRDINLAHKAARLLESGLVYLNAPTIGAECGGASFFGGWKQTGNGTRESGVASLETYTQYKTISIDYSNKLQRAQID